MLAEQLRRQRPGIPALVQVLGDAAGALEPRQHLMRHGAADAVMLGERTLVEEKAAIGEAGGDGVLELRIDPFAAVADLELVGERGGEAEAGLAEIEPERRRALAGKVAAPVEIAEQAFALELAERDRCRDAARLEGAGDAGLAEDEAGREAA